MYFAKLCRFTKVIRSFSFTVEISLEAQKAPAFMALNFFFQLSTPLLCLSSHPVWPWLWLPEVCKVGQSITRNTVCVSVKTETHTKHAYMFMSESSEKPFLASWVKDSGTIPSGLSDGSYSVGNFQGHLWYTLHSDMAAVAKVSFIYLSASVTRTQTTILLYRCGKTLRWNSDL